MNANFKNLRRQIKDPLFKNSIFIILSSAESAFFGFFFWFLAAKLYSAEAIGLATAMISSLGLLNSISRLGFDQSIIRFLPEMDRNRVFWTSALFHHKKSSEGSQGSHRGGFSAFYFAYNAELLFNACLWNKRCWLCMAFELCFLLSDYRIDCEEKQVDLNSGD
ncbi:MAG: hypothetical protein QXR77_04970 [Archaeoglobaceae archaeon]